MPNRVVKITFFAALVTFILYVIGLARSGVTTDPFDIES